MSLRSPLGRGSSSSSNPALSKARQDPQRVRQTPLAGRVLQPEKRPPSARTTPARLPHGRRLTGWGVPAMLRLRVTAGRDPLPTAPITGRPDAHTDTTVSVVIASAKVGGTLTAEEWQVTQSNRLIRWGQTLGKLTRCRKATCCFGEFDPGSGLTLAVCLRHASRTSFRACSEISGERLSNA